MAATVLAALGPQVRVSHPGAQVPVPARCRSSGALPCALRCALPFALPCALVLPCALRRAVRRALRPPGGHSPAGRSTPASHTLPCAHQVGDGCAPGADRSQGGPAGARCGGECPLDGRLSGRIPPPSAPHPHPPPTDPREGPRGPRQFTRSEHGDADPGGSGGPRPARAPPRHSGRGHGHRHRGSSERGSLLPGQRPLPHGIPDHARTRAPCADRGDLFTRSELLPVPGRWPTAGPVAGRCRSRRLAGGAPGAAGRDRQCLTTVALARLSRPGAWDVRPEGWPG